jgi:hypothetical protein
MTRAALSVSTPDIIAILGDINSEARGLRHELSSPVRILGSCV